MTDISEDIGRISDKLLTYFRGELENPNIEYRSPLARLQGGYETSIYRFQLSGVAAEYAQALVLRLYPQSYGVQNASWESAIQNVLANAGYPAAKAHFVCTDITVLGGAFFIMDHIPGQPLMFANPDTVPALMGETHAALHQLDPNPFVRALTQRGFDESGYRMSRSFVWLQERANAFPWLAEGVDWLIQNRPPEPERLSVCHGDFHPINIIVQDGRVSAVLDWGGFRIADPVFDVANTIVLTTIPAKHLSASWEGIPRVDWDLAAESYLAAYQMYKQIDPTNLDYYRVRRCLLALIQGREGQQVWQHPLVVNDVLGYINRITGIRIVSPE